MPTPADNDPFAQNIAGVRELVVSRTNKVPGSVSGEPEGAVGEYEDEFSIKLSDEELIRLSRQWTDTYRPYESKLKLRQDKNKSYYLGKQEEGQPDDNLGESNIAANVLFEAEETFIPAALAKNPEPVVWADNTKEGNDLASDLKTMLQYHADTLVLRRKLTLMVRHWSVYFLAVIKHGWNQELQEIQSEVRDIRNFIFDPAASIDCYGDYDGHYLGERITISAEKLIELFPKSKVEITLAVDGKLGTEATYTEWWTDEYCFVTFKEHILDKTKNPHFKYETEEEGLNEAGEVETTTRPGNNHFAKPKKPYTFLSVFSFGEQPHDVTNLIEQNIPNQNLVTRRTKQIDTNLSQSNNSLALSEDNFNQQTAKQVAAGRRKGNPVLIPKGRPINEAIVALNAQGFPAEAFTDLQNNIQNIRSIFGVEGITSQPGNQDTTARGMILNQQFDSSRIGGSIGDVLEQVADNVFNWWVQLYHVYYDEMHYAAIMGQMKATEYITLSAQDIDRNVVISVAPDSMKPKDEITQMNQAMSLWEQKAIDIKTLLTVLNFPDPQGTAAQAWLYNSNPEMYGMLNFPDLSQQIQQLMAAQAPQQPPGGAAQVPGSPPENLSAPQASSDLSNVPINQGAAMPQ